ncbi:MAG: hypothetical protein U0903_13490 [Planctomycetales bacterium]
MPASPEISAPSLVMIDSGAMRRRLILVASVLLCCRILTVAFTYSPDKIPSRPLFASGMLSANDRSRWATVRSLVEQNSFEIDDIIAQQGWNSIDIVRHPAGAENAHFYSSKPPFLSVLVAALYWPCYHIFHWDLVNQHFLLLRMFLLIVNALPITVAWFTLNRLIERETENEYARNYALLAMLFGTFLTTFAITLNNHTPAACAVVFALSGAWRIFRDGSTRLLDFAQAGFWSAFAVACELPAAAAFGLLGLLLLVRAPRQTITAFVPAAMIPLGFFLDTNYVATGSIKPFYSGFGTELYNFTYNGRPSYWQNPQGIDKPRDALPVYLFHCLVGHHGIFSLSPMYLFAVWSCLSLQRDSSKGMRNLTQLTLLLSVVVLGFYMTKTESYNYGGNTSGLRWMFWLIPLWILAMVPTLERYSSRKWFRGIAVVCLLISVFSATYSALNPWRHPWLFQLLEQWGVINYST